MAEQSTISASDTPKDGQSTRRTQKSDNPKLTQEEEFGILLAQIKDCRAMGIEMNWIRFNDGTIYLEVPALRTCKNRHLFLSEECPHCKDS